MKLVKRVLAWAKLMFNVDGTFLLGTLRQQFPISDMVRGLVIFLVNAVLDIFWVLLFILYLLVDESYNSSYTNGGGGHGGGGPGGGTTDDEGNAKRDATKTTLRAKVDEQIQHYIGIKTFISAVVALAVFVVLGPILRINLAHLFAIFTFFLNFIPNVGPIVATLMPLPVAILDPNLAGAQRLLSIILPFVIHGVVGNLVEPKVFGDRLELHPVVVSEWGESGEGVGGGN